MKIMTPRKQIEGWIREQLAKDDYRPGEEIDYDKLAGRVMLARKGEITSGPMMRYALQFTLERLANYVLKKAKD